MKFIMPEVDVPVLYWYIVCQTEDAVGLSNNGTREEIESLMQSILDLNPGTFTVPGYTGQIFRREPKTAWTVCWELA